MPESSISWKLILVTTHQVRVSAEDLEKERGAVLEEYRGGRNAAGRMQDSHWALLFDGSKVLASMVIKAVKR
jgi:hypothetical protein